MSAGDHGTRKQQVLRALIEVIVIATGVAFGLAGDAWWDSRKDSEREQEYLANLRQDFDQNYEDLTRSLADTDSVLYSAEYLLGLMSAERFDTPRDSLVDHIARLFMSWPHTPVTATYDELVSSGDLTLIRDHELREALARWAVLLEEHERIKVWFFDQWQTLHTPFLFEETVFTDIDSEYMGFQYPPSPHPMDYGSLLRSRKFWNLVALRVVTAMDLKNWEEAELAPETDRILALLRGGR